MSRRSTHDDLGGAPVAQDGGHQASDRPRPGDQDALAEHVTGAVHRVQGHGQRFGQDGVVQGEIRRQHAELRRGDGDELGQTT
ncbi:hypothetical protein [Streptomyces sp. enrichment culture]|uniref:hypothetical protein n=1 Tax=Streptomyces sp. enrichment culture TaxID=1795815 RepID=UPI003F5603E5